MPVKYIKIYKDGEKQKIEADRLKRFLELGWSESPEKESQSGGSKNKITAVAEVTSNEVVEDEDHVCDENCNHDWDPAEEDWADSEESFEDDELPEDEEN